jgi:hypothetical protein
MMGFQFPVYFSSLHRTQHAAGTRLSLHSRSYGGASISLLFLLVVSIEDIHMFVPVVRANSFATRHTYIPRLPINDIMESRE